MARGRTSGQPGHSADVTRASTFGSDRVAAVLRELGVTHLAMNPGATLRGLHDSVVQRPQAAPQLISCLHEEIAVGVAHGYVKAAGRPMAVALHDTVGLLHAAMAIFNAWADEAPLLAIVGTGPRDATDRRPWIDWVHTVTDQTELVRELTVWADQPSSLPAAVDAVRRAWAASLIAPRGPALVALDVELQEAPARGDEGGGLPEVLRLVGRAGPDPDLVERAARMVRTSERPLIVTDRPLTLAAGAALVALAEHVGAALCDLAGGATVPVGHPHDASEWSRDAIAAADLLLLVDVRDAGLADWPAGTASSRVGRVEIGPSRLRRGSWMSTASHLPSLRLDADVELTLGALREATGEAPRPLASAFADLTARPRRAASRTRGGIGEDDLALAVAAATRGQRPVVAVGTLHGWIRRAFRFQRPDEHLGDSGGGGLGYAVPAAIGAALALRGSGRLVVGIVGDGELLYAPQALWTAAHEQIPVLIVVNANGAYRQDWLHQRAIATARGRSTSRVGEGVFLHEPSVGIAALAHGMGIHAEGPVASVRDLNAALRRATRRVQDGEPALVEVSTRLTPQDMGFEPGKIEKPTAGRSRT